MSTSKTITRTDLKNILEEAGNIGTSVDGTDTPTSGKIAKFDSGANMNSADMTAAQVTSFISRLNTGVSDYVQRSEVDSIIKVQSTIIPSRTYAGNMSYWIYDDDVHPDTLTGYTPIGVLQASASSSSGLVSQITLIPESYGSRFVGVVRNILAADITDSITVPVLYIKDEFL